MPAAAVDVASLCRRIAEGAAAAVDLCWVQPTQLDRGRGEVRPIAGSGWRSRACDRAVAAIRRFAPEFDPDATVFGPAANPLIRAAYCDGRPASGSLPELLHGVLDPSLSQLMSASGGSAHVLACPLLVEEEVAGALLFGAARALSPQERQVCDTFSGQAALVLQNVRLAEAFHGQLQELRRSRQMIAAAEERVRGEIAERLHSRVQTRLLVAWHRLGQCRELVASEPQAACALLDELREELDAIREQEIRQLSHRLHPSIIRVGLLPALHSLLRDYEQRFAVTLEVDPQLAALDDPVSNRIAEPLRLAVYRIVQEALANVSRHAGATRVGITLQLDAGGRIRLRVRDDGQGCDTAQISFGLGLTSVATHVDQAGGSWRLVSTPGAGTTLAADVPLTAGDG